MANFTRMVPFIFHFAAGVYGKNGADLKLPVEQQFMIAQKTGWSDDPDDPGGATMIDVTLSTYSYYRKRMGIHSTCAKDLRNITFKEWSDILKTMFWDRWNADKIESQGIANLLVDWVWASGQKSIPIAQCIIGVNSDGIVGQRTLAAINAAHTPTLFNALYARRVTYYKQCRGATKYLKGWLRRLSAIRADGTFKI